MWRFERSLSAGPLSDRVVSLNMPAVAAADYSRDSLALEWVVAGLLQDSNASLLVNREKKIIVGCHCFDDKM